MLAIINDIQLIVNQEKLTVELRVKDKETLQKIEDNIDVIKNKYKKYKFFISLLKDKIGFQNLEISDIDKLSEHINQNVKLILKMKECKEIQTKNGKFMYKCSFYFINKRKTLKGIIFRDKPSTFSEGTIYAVSGKLELGDSRYIKKNEVRLGKTNEYQLKINEIYEYEFQEEETKPIYDVSRAELHCHTMYSKNDAFNTPKDYLKVFQENKCHAIAITDHGAVFGFIPFYNQLKDYLKEHPEKKLILGSEMYGFSTKEHDENIRKKKEALQEKLVSIQTSTLPDDIQEIDKKIAEQRKMRDKCKQFSLRKTISEDERNEALEKYQELVDSIAILKTELKELTVLLKENEALSISIQNDIEKIEEDLGNCNNADRDHINLLIRSQDETIDYRGEPLALNPGLVTLYKLITRSYKEFFSSPTDADKKMYGKRPMIPYEVLFEPEIRKHFIITSACAIGKHMKLALEERWNEFREWIKKLDGVEIHPTWNNSYMVEHEDYPNIKSIEDVYALHRKVYDICKEEGVKPIIVSDAHVNDKEDRILRSSFKKGYFGLLDSKFSKKDDTKKADDLDFNEDRQPFIMSINDVMEDYQKQGFTKEEIQEMLDNANELANQCTNAKDMTILPNKLFLPDFPNMNAKEELPKIVWEYAIKKWAKDRKTKETIDEKIRTRIEEELQITAEAGFEVLYMIAIAGVKKSEEMGYIVGSRGSVGSLLISLCSGISENNPLPAHYYCPTCHHVEWIETKGETGLDLPDKECPHCHEMMQGDGVDIEPHNFLGWIEKNEDGTYNSTKIPDIDQNYSEMVQSEIHQYLIDLFGEENAIKSGTQQIYQEDALKNDIFSHIEGIEKEVKEERFDIDWMANNIQTMRTTGSHPGGILLKPKDAEFEWFTPLVYVSDDPRKAEQSSAWVYHDIESQAIKIDALGHSDPTTLKELHDLTGFDFHEIRFNDKTLYDALLDPKLIGLEGKESLYPFVSCTTAISEMNTDFTMQMLKDLKPKNFYDLVAFSGLSHGTNVFNGNPQKEFLLNGTKKMEELIPYRDIIFQQLSRKYGFSPKDSFVISESVRKGKGIKKWEKELREKCPEWYISIMERISYLFPKGHAVAYITNAMRIFYYKIHYPQAFYTAIINRYGISSNSNNTIDYIKLYNKLNTPDDLYKWHSYVKHSTDNPAKEKDNIRIGNIIYEMKLRGFEIVPPDFSSKALICTPSKKDSHKILLPLSSIAGVGKETAKTLEIAYKTFGDSLFDMTQEELSELKVEKDGKQTRAFGKKFLEEYFKESA